MEVSRPCTITSNMALSLLEPLALVERLHPGLVVAHGEALVFDDVVDVGPRLHLRLHLLELLRAHRDELHPVARLEEADALLELREAPRRVPDRHRDAGEDLVAAGRRHRVDRG